MTTVTEPWVALVEYEIIVEEDPTPVTGNAIASGDDDFDLQVEEEILDRLSRGDVWAWASVQVKARLGGLYGKSSWLGCCTYEDEKDFKRDGYYDDLRAEALEDLRAKVEALRGLICDY